MGETEIDIFSTPELQSKADKARGATQLGQHLIKTQGIDKKTAGEIASHELQHSLKDMGSGKFTSGYKVDNQSGKFIRKSAYTTTRQMSDDEFVDILNAPRQKSKQDLEDIKKLKKPLWKKALGL